MTETESNWGCAAVGRSGGVSVDVDQTISGDTRWELDLEFPQFRIRFAIPSPDAVSRFRDFLLADDSNEHVIGSASLSIIRDNEFNDRFFLRADASDGALRCHWTLAGTTLTDLITALADAVSDLEA